MSTNAPDISEISTMKLKERPFPGKADFRIVISEQAYRTIWEHSRENDKVELCGVLIGEIFRDISSPFLEITAAIRGEYATNQGAQVTFTHNTWTYIHNIKDSRFPDKQIVGWYHTHPRFGVFLSPQDIFTHKSFFNQPWHIAFVIDPVSGDEGFFVWQNGNPIRVEQFWIGEKKKISSVSLEDKSASEPMTKDSLEEIAEIVPKRHRREIQPFHIFISLLILTFLLSGYLFRMNINLSQQLSLQEKHLRDIIQNTSSILNIKNIQDKKYAVINQKMKEVLYQNPELAGLDIRLKQNKGHIWLYGKVYTYRQKELIEKTVGSIKGVESVDLQGIMVTGQYTVSAGDNLTKIAQKVYGDPIRWKIIFEVNRSKIKDPDMIYPSVVLSLP
jgi:proteasome lid subunit RPN8/RPN11